MAAEIGIKKEDNIEDTIHSVRADDMDVAEALVALEAIVRSSKNDSVVSQARDIKLAIIILVANVFDTGSNLDGARNNHLALSTLRLRSARPRRVPTAQKLETVKTAGECRSLLNTGQLIAAQRATAKKTGDALPVLPRSGQRFVVATCCQYWVCGRKNFEDTAGFSVALDGGNIGGEEILVQAYSNVENGISAWAPPQALPAPFPTVGKPCVISLGVPWVCILVHV